MLIYNKLYFKEGQTTLHLSAGIINPLGSNLCAQITDCKRLLPLSSEFSVANVIYVQSDFISFHVKHSVQTMALKKSGTSPFAPSPKPPFMARDIPDDLALTLVFHTFYDFFAVNRKNVNLFMSCSYARGCYGSPSKAAKL